MNRKAMGIQPFKLLVLAGSALTLSGCSVIESQYGKERYRSLEGKNLSEITRASSLAYHNGQLIVASRGMARGIAIVDTGTETVIGFHSLKIQPTNMTLDTAGRLFLFQDDLNDGRATGWIDLKLQVYYPSPSVSVNAYRTFTAGDEIFWGTSNWTGTGWVPGLTQVKIEGTALTPKDGIYLPSDPTNIAVVGDRLYMTLSEGSNWLYVRGRQPPFGLIDSLNLLPASHADAERMNISALVAKESTVYAIVNLPDTSFISVLDGATGVQTGSIPLNFTNVLSGGLHGGAWYVYGIGIEYSSGGVQVLDGGLEAVDLDAQTNLGVLATELEIGGTVRSYAPVNASKGYVLFENGSIDWENRTARKIIY